MQKEKIIPVWKEDEGADTPAISRGVRGMHFNHDFTPDKHFLDYHEHVNLIMKFPRLSSYVSPRWFCVPDNPGRG